MDAKQFIFAGWLLDGSGGPVREKVILQVKNGTIAGMESCSRENISDLSNVTDLSHCTILPPLIDSHVHLFMSGTIDPKVREDQLIAGYDDLKPSSSAKKEEASDSPSFGDLPMSLP